MKTWVLIITCTIGSLFAYGRYNGVQAKKQREQKAQILVNKQIEEYWPQGQGAKVITYPKQIPTAPNSKSNVDVAYQSIALKVDKWYKQLEPILITGYDTVCSAINKLEIKTAKTSKSPFINLFPKETNVANNIEKPPAVKRPRPPTAVAANKKITSKRLEQNTNSSSVVTRTVPLQVAEMPKIVHHTTIERSVPVPIVNSNNQIEVYEMDSIPSVPKANFDYVVVNYSR